MHGGRTMTEKWDPASLRLSLKGDGTPYPSHDIQRRRWGSVEASGGDFRIIRETNYDIRCLQAGAEVLVFFARNDGVEDEGLDVFPIADGAEIIVDSA